MDTSSAPARPPTLRGTTEHRNPAGNSPHYAPQQPPLRRVTSNPSELATTRMLRRVEGTLCKRFTNIYFYAKLNVMPPKIFP